MATDETRPDPLDDLTVRALAESYERWHAAMDEGASAGEAARRVLVWARTLEPGAAEAVERSTLDALAHQG